MDEHNLARISNTRKNPNITAKANKKYVTLKAEIQISPVDKDKNQGRMVE